MDVRDSVEVGCGRNDGDENDENKNVIENVDDDIHDDGRYVYV